MIKRQLHNKVDDNIDVLINKVNRYIGKITPIWYKHPYYITNPVLSRNIFTSDFFQKVIDFEIRNKKTKYKVNFLSITIQLGKYYFKSAVFFAFFVLHFFCYKFSKLKFQSANLDNGRELIVIDTFTMIDRIFLKKKFEDNYFSGLYECLNKLNKSYVVLSILFGDKTWNLKRRLQTYNILSKDYRHFVTEFNLLKFSDYILLIYFIILYPILTLRLLNISVVPHYDEIFKHEIIDTIDQVQFDNYLRYLVGKNLQHLHCNIKLISWYENQVIDKLLYRGLKSSDANSIIFGTRFFGIVNSWLNLLPLEEEKTANVIPDIILAKGGRYLPKNTSLNYTLGAAPRENYIFDIKIAPDDVLKKNDTLILLTYDIDESRRIIDLVNFDDSKIFQTLHYKLHPNHQLSHPFNLPQKWKMVTCDLKGICQTTKIVISGGTGAALESACLGCSVILVGHPDRPTANPFPKLGKGEIWDIAYSKVDIIKITNKLDQYRQNNVREFCDKIFQLRQQSFYPISDEKLISVFEL
jgi:hypothetical protein